MVGLEGEGERVARGALAELQREVEELRRRDERHTRWLDALALVAEEFRREPGRVAVDNGLDVVLRHTNALDGAVAFYVSGQLVMPSSRRGLLESNPVTVSAHPELARCLRDAEPAWLDAAASSAIGVPPDLHASAIPIVVAGETMGLLVFVFADVEPHDEDNGRLLDGGLGRHGLRAAARPPGPGAARGRRRAGLGRRLGGGRSSRSCVPPAHLRRRLGPPSHVPIERA